MALADRMAAQGSSTAPGPMSFPPESGAGPSTPPFLALALWGPAKPEDTPFLYLPWEQPPFLLSK